MNPKKRKEESNGKKSKGKEYRSIDIFRKEKLVDQNKESNKNHEDLV